MCSCEKDTETMHEAEIINYITQQIYDYYSKENVRKLQVERNDNFRGTYGAFWEVWTYINNNWCWFIHFEYFDAEGNCCSKNSHSFGKDW